VIIVLVHGPSIRALGLAEIHRALASHPDLLLNRKYSNEKEQLDRQETHQRLPSIFDSVLMAAACRLREPLQQIICEFK